VKVSDLINTADRKIEAAIGVRKRQRQRKSDPIAIFERDFYSRRVWKNTEEDSSDT
jgi:hypothetical protein